MHISEGVLAMPVIVGGYAVTAVGVTLGLRMMRDQDVVKTAVLSSAFFVAALIHIPVGPGNVHLVLNGLLGLLLGPVCFCAIFVALLLQGILFQFGGLTSLGVNTCNMALPAVACFFIFKPIIKNWPRALWASGFATGFVSVGISALMLSLALVLSGQAFQVSAKVLLIAHVPVMIIDGLITALSLQFIYKMKPEMLCR